MIIAFYPFAPLRRSYDDLNQRFTKSVYLEIDL